jgi:hypothetical protein
MPRSDSDGPFRSVMARKPPGFSRVTSFLKARLRSVGATCIQTALSRIKSKDNPRRKVCSRPGSRSGIQRMRGSGWRACPSTRMAAEGSTATTSWPCAASQAASRPVPAPISRTSPGRSGIALISQSCTCSNRTLSYRAATIEAFSSYHAIDAGSDKVPKLASLNAKWNWHHVRRIKNRLTLCPAVRQIPTVLDQALRRAFIGFATGLG